MDTAIPSSVVFSLSSAALLVSRVSFYGTVARGVSVSEWCYLLHRWQWRYPLPIVSLNYYDEAVYLFTRTQNLVDGLSAVGSVFAKLSAGTDILQYFGLSKSPWNVSDLACRAVHHVTGTNNLLLF